MSQLATERFHKLREEKRQRVLEAAVAEFATYGYEAANTNRIAHEAGISVGALFKYFTSKQDLFRFVVASAAELIEDRVGALLEAPGDTLSKFEELVRLAVASASEQRALVRLYHEITGTGTSEMVHETARALESFTSRSYVELVRQGQARGDVRTDVDPEVLAFCVDNLLMTLQFSYACNYFTDRAGLYLGADFAERDEHVVAHVCAFVRQALEVR